MSERERWIVYPLLFLALGGALRDKIIKTTESQRIKCQGLYVFDSQDRPLLVLGPEQFPELRANAPNMLRVDEVLCDRLDADLISSQKVVGARFAAPQDSVGVLDAEMVIAKNYVLSDGRNHLRLDGRFTVPLMRFIAAVQQHLGTRLLVPLQPDGGGASDSEPADDAAPESPPAGEDAAEEGPELTAPVAEVPAGEPVEGDEPADEPVRTDN